MYLGFMPILFFVLMIAIIVFMIFYSKELKRNEPIKQAKALNSVKENLKEIKNVFDNQGEYNYNIKSSMLILYLAFVVACGLSAYLGYCVFSEGSYKFDDIKGFATSILLVFITLLLIIMKNNIKSIKLNNSELTIKSKQNTKEYNIQDIEKLNIEIITTHSFKTATTIRIPFFNIKDTNNSKQDSYEVKYTSLNNIIALIIYINLIKQNNVDTINTLTEEEIKKLEDEIFI